MKKLALLVLLLIPCTFVRAQNGYASQNGYDFCDNDYNNYNSGYYNNNSCDSECCTRYRWGSFRIGADWIYWKPYQDNLFFATANNVIDIEDEQDITIISSSLIDPEFDHDSGVRVFLNYGCCASAWQVGLIYTHLMSNAKKDLAFAPFDAGNFILLLPNSLRLFFEGEPLPLSSLNTKWRLQLNYLDLDFGRCYSCCHCFDISPHFGLRGLWMTERLHLSGVTSDLTETFTAQLRDQLDAFGIEGGLTAELDLCWSFNFTGTINAALLYSRIKTVDRNTIVSEGAILDSKTTSNIHHLCPMIEGFIGIEYECSFDCVTVELHLGWEQHIIMNANQFALSDFSDLSLQGVTFGGSLIF